MNIELVAKLNRHTELSPIYKITASIRLELARTKLDKQIAIHEDTRVKIIAEEKTERMQKSSAHK